MFVVYLSSPLNDFSSETPKPIFLKPHGVPSVKGELKICTDVHGEFIKMTAMPIHVKMLKYLLLQNPPKKHLRLDLGISGNLLSTGTSYPNGRCHGTEQHSTNYMK